MEERIGIKFIGMTRFMNRWQKSIPLLSKIHFVRSLMIDDEMMVGRVFFVSKENSIRGMDGALRYCRCGFCKRIARNRSLALCVFPSRFPLLSPSPSPCPSLGFTWFFPLLLFSRPSCSYCSWWGPRENDHVPNHPSGIGEI